MGAHQLSGIQCHRSTSGSLGVQRYRTQAFFSDVHWHLHRLELPLRDIRFPSHAAYLPRAPRRWRWRAATDGAGDHGGFVRGEEAGPGIRTVCPGNGAGALHRANHRRLGYRQLQLEMDFLYQYSGGNTCRDSGNALCRRSALD